MVKRNPHFTKVSDTYLFRKVMQKVNHYKEKYPDTELISLSIGDTSEPLGKTITEGLMTQAAALGSRSGYSGYGAEQGNFALRAKISEVFYKHAVDPDEIFISDGAKCDIGRLQLLFGNALKIGIQDPTYPVYADTGGLLGNSTICYLPCNEENDFFPRPDQIPQIDLLYLCSPNNPTGAAASYEQLQSLISWAKRTGAFLIFDAAYSGFIQDPSIPRSIYDVEGGSEVAIEVSSFSKLIGFTGVRAGWCVVPKKLQFEEGHLVHTDYQRLISTFFNGASVISQAGALAALSSEGLSEMKEMLSFYQENAHLLAQVLKNRGLKVYGGSNAPYLWVNMGLKSSWELFDTLLETTGIITTPGSGFGNSGEGFLRFSAFGSRNHILKAIERLEKKWPEKL